MYIIFLLGKLGVKGYTIKIVTNNNAYYLIGIGITVCRISGALFVFRYIDKLFHVKEIG